MTKLKYTFKNDILFKMLFVKYPDLLKRLVAELLGIQYEIIEHFEITNPDMPPESMGDKFCRLDINMIVNGRIVDLEIQVKNEGDYPERTLFNWALEYSTALPEGEDYSKLPRTIVVSIIYFKQFKCKEFHSEFHVLEVTRHTPLTDKLCLHYFELPKLPKTINTGRGLELWLALFKAKTEEDLKNIEILEVPVMKQAIGAYRHVSASPEFREKERLYSKARHDEAQALKNATERERKKWQNVVATKDATIAEKDAKLADKDAENERLRKLLAEFQPIKDN